MTGFPPGWRNARATARISPEQAPVLWRGRSEIISTIMDEPKSVIRRYSDREIALILTRTAELQVTRAAESEVTAGLTQDDLEQIAREAGLDPRYVRMAIADLDGGRGTRESRWLGGASWIQLERAVTGEVPEREYEALVDLIQRTLGEAGQPSVLGRTLRWIALTGVSGRHALGREIEVTIASRDGQTTISVHEKLRAFATQLFTGFLAGGGSGGAALAAGLGGALLGSPVAAVVFGVGAFAAAYATARTIFGRTSRRRAEQLRALIDRLSDHVASTAVSVTLPDDTDTRSTLDRPRRAPRLTGGEQG